MRTVKFEDVLRGAAESTGRIFDTISNDEFALFRGFISRRLREAWESEYWPELMQIESRRYGTGTWSATGGDAGDGVYQSADIVYHSTSYYQANTATTSSDVPGVSADWDLVTDFHHYIEYEQPGQTELGQVYRILSKDPQINHNWIEYDFTMSSIGVTLINGPDLPYIEFRKRAPELTGSDWDTEVAYAVDGQVYYSGDFWDALTVRSDSTAAPTSSDTVNWEKQSIPYIFKPYLEKAVASEMLLLDEKPELAMAQQAMAREALDIEAIKLYRQQGQTSRIKVRTY
jgi:hypothetical protein